MNQKLKAIVVVAILIGIMIGLLVFISVQSRIVDITEIENFQYRINNSMLANGDVVYSLSCTTHKCVAGYKPYGVDKVKERNVDTKFVQKLEGILEKYDVRKWNGFHKSDSYVLDGSSFSLDIIMRNGDIISASGYMKYPTNYREFLEDLSALYDTIY